MNEGVDEREFLKCANEALGYGMESAALLRKIFFGRHGDGDLVVDEPLAVAQMIRLFHVQLRTTIQTGRPWRDRVGR